MSLQEQLTKVEHEINRGMLFKAAERLKILINQYPDDISLRNRLALLYYESGFKDAAGKYWMLCEPTQEHIKNAIEVYKLSVNNSSNKILQDIRFKGNYDNLPEYSRNILFELKVSTGGRLRNYVDKTYHNTEKSESRLGTIGCYFVLVFIAILFLTGLVTLIEVVIEIFN